MVAECILAAGMDQLPYCKDFSIPEHLSSKCVSRQIWSLYMYTCMHGRGSYHSDFAVLFLCNILSCYYIDMGSVG